MGVEFHLFTHLFIQKVVLCTYEPEKVQGVKDIVAREKKNNQDVFCVKHLSRP